MAALVSAVLIGAPLSALSQVGDLAYLKNESEEHASRELSWRGFYLAHVAQRPSVMHQFWWNTSRDFCVRIAVQGDRISEVRSSDDHDCNQRHGGSKGPSQGAQVAIAAAAILGVGVLAHKSHDNDKDRASRRPRIWPNSSAATATACTTRVTTTTTTAANTATATRRVRRRATLRLPIARTRANTAATRPMSTSTTWSVRGPLGQRAICRPGVSATPAATRPMTAPTPTGGTATRASASTPRRTTGASS